MKNNSALILFAAFLTVSTFATPSANAIEPALRNPDSTLRIATREGRIKEVRETLRGSVNVNAQAERGFTPLMYAAANCYTDIAGELIHSGADGNLKDNRGRTALMIAASSGCPGIVRLLLNQPKTQVSLKDKAGNTAYDHAVTAAEVDYGGRANESALLLKRRGVRGKTATSQLHYEERRNRRG